MRLALSTAALVVALPAAAAENPACPYVIEALEYTADVLLATRDGGVSREDVFFLADAQRRAAEEMRGGEWTEGAIAAADEAFFLAWLHLGGFDANASATLLKLGDTIAAETATTCDPRRIPIFVRPGVGDGRACPQVARALKSIEMALPAIAGAEGAPKRTVLLIAANESQKAARYAEVSQWSMASIAALKAVTGEARALLKAPERTGDAESTAFKVFADPAKAEAMAICGSEMLQ